ncbi:MAG: hypothetical protein WCE75_07485, partial [Terracidiphilus sp.]
QFSRIQLNTVPESPPHESPVKSGGLPDSRQEPENVPAMAKRLILLSKLKAVHTPSVQTAIYIREAARTYYFGLFQASAAMSRAALEQSIKERLGRQADGNYITFQDLIADAKKWRILDDSTLRQAKDTAKKADLVLHERPTDEDGALGVLIEVRGLLQEIHSTTGGF